MLDRLLQYWNACSPMLVTLSGIVMLDRLLQPEKALFGIISVHPNSKLYPPFIGPAVVSLQQPWKA